jgi:copper transport protein
VRRAVATAVALAAALAVPAVAWAHATMKESHPAEQGRVAQPPHEITLRFDQSVEAPPNAIVVLAPNGRRLSGAVTQANRNTVVRAPVLGAVTGQAYTVRWRVVSADGHVGTGVFTFGVGVTPPPPTEAVGSSGMTWRDDAARWALFASLALMIGVVGIRLLVLPGDVDPRVERRIHLLGTLGAFLALNAGIAGFVIRSANALQVSGVDLLYADLSPFAESTRFGTAFLVTTLGFGVCLTILVVAWALDAPLLRWPAFLLGLALVWGYPLSGHQATEPNSTPLGEIADWVHLVSAMLWVGGVLTLAVVVWPLAPGLRRAAFLRFSRVAVLLIGLLLVAGTVVAIERLPELSDLWGTSYGRTLLVKIALVLVALGWGAFHHTFVRPRLERGETPPGVGRSLLGESAVALAVLFAAAVLVNGAPPPVETGPTTATPAARR